MNSSPYPENHYSDDFYRRLQRGVNESANVLLPMVLDLVRPRSIIDVGCGQGVWLDVCQQLGIETIFGVDGPHVNSSDLKISKDDFLAADLCEPLDLDRQFDLAMSLEVAEHLPENAAESFVKTLTTLAPVVLFSAAIPFQRGTHHVNEQWPDYWAKWFGQQGYLPIDCLRSELWKEENVEWWYAQNVMLYVKQSHQSNREKLSKLPVCEANESMRRVHPKNYLQKVWAAQAVKAQRDITRVIPEGVTFVLADHNEFAEVDWENGRLAVPFTEREGQYWGPPSDSAKALGELERQRRGSASFFVVAWPAFWLLQHFEEFNRVIRSKFQIILENDRVVVFQMNTD